MKIKKYVSILIASAIFLSNIAVPVYASDNTSYSKQEQDATISGSALETAEDNYEGQTEYPYTLFAASNDENAIDIVADNFCLNGNIATNGTISISGNSNINGYKTEKANLPMIDISEQIVTKYMQDYEVTDSRKYEDINISIDNPIIIEKNFQAVGNTNINSCIKTKEDIKINGEVLNINNGILFSENGNIIINSNNININGLLYSPNGIIEISGDTTNLNNVIIIAKKIIIHSSNVNINHNTDFATFVNSELNNNLEENDENKTDNDKYDINSITIYAMGYYNTDNNCVEICWASNYIESSYKIYVSDNNVDYDYIATVDKEYHYSYELDGEFDTKYIKVVLTTVNGEVVEAIPFVVKKDDEGYYVDLLDSDDDIIPDVLEWVLNSNVDKADSDDDGLIDYLELLITNTDPNKYDSVEEGISDLNADNDYDGLSNKEEIENGTNPNYNDSDDDNISDGDEVKLYNTKPTKSDSDDDDLDDDDELALGFDPLKYDTNDNGIKDGDEKINQTTTKPIECPELPGITDVSVSLSINGNIEKVVSIQNMYNIDIFSSDVVGLVGAPIEFISENEFESAEVKFTYDENNLGFEADDLGVLWYNEEEQCYVIMDTTIDKEQSTISFTTPHFSEYMVVDLKKWFAAWEKDIDYNKSSIEEKNKNWKGKAVTAQELCDTYNKYYNYTDAITLSDVLPACEDSDKYVLFGTINIPIKNTNEVIEYDCIFLADEEFSLLSYGRNEYGLLKIFPQCGGWTISYTDYNQDNYKFVDINGEYNHWALYDDVDINKMSIVYTGKFFVPAFETDQTDNDNDGLLDIYEYIGMRLANGHIIRTSTESAIDPKTGKSYGYDSDKDGICDGDEIFRQDTERGYFVLKSDPNKIDSDDDGLYDNSPVIDKKDSIVTDRTIAPTDPNPLVKDGPEGVWKYHVQHRLANEAPHKLGEWYNYTRTIDSIKDVTDLGNDIIDTIIDPNKRLEATQYIKDELKDFVDKGIHSRLAISLSNFLMFRLDEQGVCLHSQTAEDIKEVHQTDVGEMDWPHIASAMLLERTSGMLLGEQRPYFNGKDMWQRTGGYCKLYDLIFKIGTADNMKNEVFYFNDSLQQKYALWVWRGSYLNLGSGCEMGLYTNSHELPVLSGIDAFFKDHADEFDWLGEIGIGDYMNLDIDDKLWDVADLELPMQIYLYNKYDDGKVEHILQWEPTNPQWWITAFNPECYPPNVKQMVMIGMIDFSGHIDMYQSVIKELKQKNQKFVIMDDNEYKMWVIWYEV